MPELPEVETIRRGLEKQLPGLELKAIEIYTPTLLRFVAQEDLNDALPGGRVEAVARRGKYLFLDFHNGWRLEFHLRMTGRLVFDPGGIPPGEEKHLRARLNFYQDGSLLFYDQRKFGTLRLRRRGEEPSLGVEPLGPDFTVAYLGSILSGRKAPVKSVLLNQAVIAGLGNIYADEALHAAGIYPGRRAGELSPAEIAALHRAVIEVLDRAVQARGTSFRDYRDSQGEKGGFQDLLAVYQREGQKCHRCGCEIKKVRVANRGTHYCPQCQPEKS